jgi:hypothetical protein
MAARVRLGSELRQLRRLAGLSGAQMGQHHGDVADLQLASLTGSPPAAGVPPLLFPAGSGWFLSLSADFYCECPALGGLETP